MTEQFESLRGKFQERNAVIAVVGQGYVGLPLAVAVAEAGFLCIGIDINEPYVTALNDGVSHIADISDERLKAVIDSGNYRATTDYTEAAEADAVSICVPTPLRKTRDPDLSYIQAAAESLIPHLKRPALVVLESTTYPGTTQEHLMPLLNGPDRPVDEDIFIAFSPERVDPGNQTYRIENTPKVVGGVSEASTQLVQTLYNQFIDHVHTVQNATEAEIVKLLENTFRAVNIALVNEMAIMCDRMDIDIWEVIEAAKTKPFGFMPFYPGPGIGGHCIPLDPTYLSWRAKSFGFYNRFIELASDINTNMPRFVVNKFARVMNDRGKAINGSAVLLVGMAYKPDVDDLRESPALDIWALLDEWGAQLQYHDMHVPQIPKLDGARSTELTPEVLANTDAVIITTDHSALNLDVIVEHANLIFDTRHAIKEHSANVIRL